MGVLRHFGALIPGQRTAELFRQRDDRTRDCVAHRFGAMSGKRWTIINAWLAAVTCHAGQVKQHGVSRRALDQGPDRRTTQSKDEVPLPMPRNGPSSNVCWAFANQDIRRDERLTSAASACSW
jgi:hypothetical protein